MAAKLDLPILYEEGPCLVIAKPGGLLTQAPAGIDSVESRVKQYLLDRRGTPGNVYLGVPHRLDRPVSGALVLGLHVRAARRLAEQFEGRTVKKVYWALVEGCVSELAGTWTDHLRKVPGEARAEVVDEDHPEARHAALRYRVLQRSTRQTWLELILETGRTHQIRVQSASRGFPVVGDQQYGAHLPFGPDVEDPRDRWIALHAHALGFRHPMSQEWIELSAPLPGHWAGQTA